jgi:hypothetical protein
MGEMRYSNAAWKTLPIPEQPSFYELARHDLTEPSQIEADGGELIGRDPRQLSKETLAKYYPVEPGGAGNGRVVRAKCLDCCCYQEAEIRKCTALACALWPYRMGTNPFTNRKGNPRVFAPVERGANLEVEEIKAGVP